MIRIVIDTNVLISGLLWQGLPSRLMKLVDNGHLLMCLNESMLDEVADVLRRDKFHARLQELGLESSQLVSIVAEKALLFEDLHIPPIIKNDPDDDKVIGCALASKSKFIVSGDQHLLKLERFEHIKILSPAKALNLLTP